MELMMDSKKKFSNPDITAKGETRAWVDPVDLKTLWINTGTLCNLQCVNCYIESSPKNDSLVYITDREVKLYLDEIKAEEYGTTEIAFTGGEPFLNPYMIDILKGSLAAGFEALVLTNAMKPMQKFKEELLDLKNNFGSKLKFRVSLDHYSEKLHSQERGPKAWKPALEGLRWLSEEGFSISIAGRTLWNENEEQIRGGYASFFRENGINLDSSNLSQLILFPEMDDNLDVPEITTACWGILNKKPDDIMCATSRMVVKRKGADRPAVIACTLLPYENEFELGSTIKESFTSIKLNHPYCAKFCVLGGGSCSQ